MRIRHLLFVLVWFVAAPLVTALLVPASSIAAPTGVITNAVANQAWTEGKVDNLAVSLDQCGPPKINIFGYADPCLWEASAILPPPGVGCSADQYASNGWQYLSTESTIWVKGVSGNGSVESGPLTFYLRKRPDQPPIDHICLFVQYIQLFSGVPIYTPELLSSVALTPVKFPPSPACRKATKARHEAQGKLLQARRHLKHNPSAGSQYYAQNRAQILREATTRMKERCSPWWAISQ
jgi:hypothetical protein